jgi:hypothetical protein
MTSNKNIVAAVAVLGTAQSIPGRGRRLLSSPQRPDRYWDALSLFSTRVKRPELEADQSL